ncbi:histidine phosphatase family protein [Paraburkholderia silviterrae]|uniref:Histidine phosphatase family protein n=1 Tax=Paraburkholderia silviterrae TaxID=2528715 RepID=A0A4R5MEJ4_9BURK|nr:histidine phosphatase family protein [Paraburkholderia silviterrae]TDG25193.1 histidine phosphatase family protein [Paraburkholderia silviterrae]
MPGTTVWLVCHAANAALRAGTFPRTPGGDNREEEAFDARAIEAIEAWRARWQARFAGADGQAPRALTSPAAIARASAQAAGFAAERVDALADAAYGVWQGLRLANVAREQPDALAAWTRDPAFRPPGGGESFDGVRSRVGAWLDALPEAEKTVVAFTHAPVIRAAILHALSAPSASFRHLEIAPLAVTALRRSAQGWAWIAALP